MTAVKEILEDYKRHAADKDVNRRLVKVFREGTFQTLRWTQVQCGDIVKVLDRQFFPADLVLVSSSEPQGMCYVETANLDGETNLKIRQGLPQTNHVTSTREVRAFSGRVECEGPNNRLYKFVGNVHFTSSTSSGEQTVPLSADQLLLRGAQLRNTPWVYGIVVYTGHESKLMKNNTAAPSKRSNVDNVTNTQILGLFFVLVCLSVITTIGNEVWYQEHIANDWYLGFSSSDRNGPMYNFLTCIILYNMLIPISLIVTLEFVKFCQALMFINNDLDMYDPTTDTPARAVTSTLNEELGQIKYIFSDKTGTLTRNIMQFLKATIGGISYGDIVQQTDGDNDGFVDPALLDNLTSNHPTASVIREWLTLLAVCHTVVPERDREDPDKIVYQAASPDEEALVLAVKALGFSFNVRTPQGVIINALGAEEKYDVLNVLEFNSTRKRMSVIVRTPNGLIKLYCKGADTVIYERLKAGKQPYADVTQEHLKRFAADGLRTLCLAVAQLTEDQYQAWLKKYDEAAQSIVDRADKMDQAAELIEKDLFLLGATAIEDKLQVGVPECISKLAKAGIKIWVLTGDKQETAINIGYSCQLLKRKMKLLICNEYSVEDIRRWISKTNSEMGFKIQDKDEELETLALVIDGGSLLHALEPDVAEDWLRLARRCKAVICCRVSPKQKADVVRLVKESVKAITLAIGDGANDVGMIQAADVGVGISGQEGLQAARAADYAIGQFRFLSKLLLVHGNWSYRRITSLILYFFYKNLSLTLVELYFAFSNGFSGQIFFEKWMISSFNMFFTFMPPLVIGIFDQHVSKESLLQHPELYKSGQRGDHYNNTVFWTWTVNAFFHCTLLYFLTLEGMKTQVARKDGLVQGQWFIGSCCYAMVVYTVTLKAAMISRYWVKWTHLAIWGSLLVWVIFTLMYFNLYGAELFGTMAVEVYGLDFEMYTSLPYWLMLFLFPVTALFCDFSYKVFQETFFPRADQMVRSQEVLGIQMLASIDDNQEMGQFASTHTGFAFSQSESTDTTVVSQADLIRRYDTEKTTKPEGD